MEWTPEIIQMIWKGIGETLYMTLLSTIYSIGISVWASNGSAFSGI